MKVDVKYWKDDKWEQAALLMDDDLREELHRLLAPCSRSAFAIAYAAAHRKKFDEDFAPFMGGAW